ncbi:MAG: hypothetical protein ABUL60_21120 [Myxococcales bacterium]
MLLWLARSSEHKRRDRQALRVFSHRIYLSAASDDAWDDWDADLVAMTVVVQRCVPDRDDPPSAALPLRRTQDGQWRVQSEPGGKGQWQAVPPDVAQPLESQYQRFLLQRRER